MTLIFQKGTLKKKEYVIFRNLIADVIILETPRELSQITFAFLAFFDREPTLVCTFTVVNVAFC